MIIADLRKYTRTLLVSALVLAALVFSYSDLRLDVWHGLLPLFEWMETTWFGVIGKTWGAAFAVVEAFHLLAMALLGGAVLVSDCRLLGLVFTDIPTRQILDPDGGSSHWCFHGLRGCNQDILPARLLV